MADVQVQFGADISALVDAVKKAGATISDFAGDAKAQFDSLGDTLKGAATANGSNGTVDVRGTVLRAEDLSAGKDTSGATLGTYEADKVGPLTLASGAGGAVGGSSSAQTANSPGFTIPIGAISISISTTCSNCFTETRAKSTVLLPCQKL